MRRIAAFLAACSAGAALAVPAIAITNGTPDGTGHPNVGALIADIPGVGRVPICSGTLLSSKVFATAAHCTAPLEELGVTRVWVTFEPVLDVTRNLRSGTVHTDPAYGLDAGFLHDLGVVTLDAPVNGIKPAQLPTAGLLDGADKKATYTVVGFGVTAPNAPADGVRRFVTAESKGLQGDFLRLSQNSSQTGYGGVCYGDSGGPTFLGTTIVALTSNGNKSCTGNAYQYRLDTPSARCFLSQYVALP